MRAKQLFISLTLGLGLTLGLLWLLGGATLPAAHAAPSQCPDQRPLLQAGDVITVCLSGGCDYISIQEALDAADPGDEILVAAGTYTDVNVRPRNDITTTGVVTQMVYISKTVTIRGGYNADFSAWDPDTYSTTLNAQGQGRVLYITGDPSASSGQAISPTIEGLHITGGDAGGGQSVSESRIEDGGGVYVISATVTFSNNQVFSNTADDGGGVYVISATAVISGNTIVSNTAEWDGGGLYLASSDATLSDNTFISNTAKTGYGGGLMLGLSNATLSSNTFISNTAHGGGGLVLAFSTATLQGNTISYNAADGGGGLDVSGGSVTLSGNIVISNTAHSWGGGLYVDQGSNATLINNAVVSNRADSQGSGLYILGCSPRLLHTTIAHNTGGDGSGIYVTDQLWVIGGTYSTVALTNTILVSHSVGISVTGGNTVTVNGVLWYGTHVTVSQATTATVTVRNQHQGDPAFAADGYHLTGASAAIDRGVNAGVTTDIDDDARPDGCLFDIGADEFMTGVACRYIYLPLIMRQYQ
jgi:fibronectin-binding autotransporter adhesin